MIWLTFYWHSIEILKEYSLLDLKVLQGSIETLFRWSVKHYNFVVTDILWDMDTKKYENQSIFDGVI